MADARLTVAQLTDLLRRLDEVATHTQFVRQTILEAMARRTRAAKAEATASTSARRNRTASPRRRHRSG